MSKKDRRSQSRKKSKDASEPDNPNAQLPGWPGYRTRDGRSGYDPIDTRTEAAHTAGTILQKLITGRIRNPVYLVLLGILGLVLITPLFLTIVELVNGNLFPWNAWLFALITGIAGIAILINFIRNLIQIVFRQ
jgi:hypothetical protein